MLFVIDKPQLQRVIAIVRDDRRKEDQGLAGPFLRLEARDDFLKLDGLEVSGKIPAMLRDTSLFNRKFIGRFMSTLVICVKETFGASTTSKQFQDLRLCGNVILFLQSRNAR